MADAINISKVDQYAKKYKSQLLALALLDQNVFADFNVLPGIKDEFVLTTLRMGNVVKPYTKNWNPSTGGELEPRTLKVHLGKVELEEEPLKYRTTYLGFLMKAGVNEKDHPFEKFFTEEVMRKMKSEINLETTFNGVRNAAGNSAKDLANGFLKIIEDEITALKVTPIVTGVIDNSNAVAKLKGMYKGLPKQYREVMMNIYCSYEDYDAYCENYQTKNGALPYNTQYEHVYLEGSNRRAKLVPKAGFGDSRRIIMTPLENMCIGVDLASDQEKIGINNADVWVVKFYAAFAYGLQIAQLDALFVNDQA
ncbi:hypothetical protein [uncultured Pontibacter sp.]|uniref:hypothetical protein n=1 Tax=uncultured Pontibacter sp. TaxID=453356 RepID=UPI002629528E|nr:hypothetical protein [uncultured Pontibacter sp.]